MDFAEHVAHLLEQQYPGAQVDVGFAYGAEKLNGSLVWAGFDGLEQIDRQRLLGAYLRAALGPDAQRVSTILTYTPHEAQVMASV